MEASKEYRDMMKKYNMKDEEVYPDTWWANDTYH
jgi:hypothetical protein